MLIASQLNYKLGEHRLMATKHAPNRIMEEWFVLGLFCLVEKRKRACEHSLNANQARQSY